MKKILFSLIAILMIGCSRPAAYSFFIAIDDNGWETTELAAFHIDTLPQKGYYECMLHLRTSTAHPYPYKQLMAEVQFKQNDSLCIATDTICFNLYNESNKEKSAGISMHTHSLRLRDIYYHPEHPYQIIVRHLMDTTPLPGIIAVGLELNHTAANDR